MKSRKEEIYIELDSVSQDEFTIALYSRGKKIELTRILDRKKAEEEIDYILKLIKKELRRV